MIFANQPASSNNPWRVTLYFTSKSLYTKNKSQTSNILEWTLDSPIQHY